MKLLIVTPIYPPVIGGPATYVSTLITKLSKSIKTEVITFANEDKQEGFITKISIKQNSFLRQLNLFRAIYCKLKYSDVCYVQGTLTVGLNCMIACKLLGKSYIVKYVGDEIWESYQNSGGEKTLEEFLENKKGLVDSIKIVLQTLILKNSRAVVVPGEYLKSVIKKYYKINNVQNIPNAVETIKIESNKKKKTLIYVGRLVSWKNIDFIIQAVGILKNKSKQDWRLVIVGEGGIREKLVLLVKKLKLSDNIIFTGALPRYKVLEQVAQAEYLVLYSSYEGLSHTLLDAMMLKTKIIASDIVANRDVLENGSLGKLVSLYNQDELVSSLLEEYSETKIENAYKTVKEKYSWDNHIDHLLKLISYEYK